MTWCVRCDNCGTVADSAKAKHGRSLPAGWKTIEKKNYCNVCIGKVLQEQSSAGV